MVKLQMYGRRMSEVARLRAQSMQESKVSLTPAEVEVLSAWRWKTFGNGALAWVASFGIARMPPWPLSGLVSSVFATVVSGVVGFGVFATQAPKAVDKMLKQEGRSAVMDSFFCPAIFELEPCLKDPECAAALGNTNNFLKGDSNITDLIRQCRQRHQRFQSGDSYATESADFDNFNQTTTTKEQQDDRWYTPPTQTPFGEDDFPSDKPPPS